MQPRSNASTVVERVGDELLVLDRTTEQLHHLNVTASWIFSQCDGATTCDELVARMLTTFDVELAVAERDLGRALTELAGLGLLDPQSIR